MEVSVYNTSGKQADTYTLPESCFNVSWNSDLIHQVVTSVRANQRAGIAHTKDRSEVRGGGRKPWRQKGTGRARHGSRRSPLWSGGGITHGPRVEKTYKKKINKKMYLKAFGAVLSRKAADNELLVVDVLDMTEPKTKAAEQVLTTLASIENFACLGWETRKNCAHIVVPELTEAIRKSFRNIPGVSVSSAAEVSILDVLNKKRLILVGQEAIDALADRWTRVSQRGSQVVAKQ